MSEEMTREEADSIITLLVMEVSGRKSLGLKDAERNVRSPGTDVLPFIISMSLHSVGFTKRIQKVFTSVTVHADTEVEDKLNAM